MKFCDIMPGKMLGIFFILCKTLCIEDELEFSQLMYAHLKEGLFLRFTNH
jgi:hypothetical protein